MRHEALIFDLDGVLVDTAKYHYLAWKQLADQLDIPFNERDNERFKGVSRARLYGDFAGAWGPDHVSRGAGRIRRPEKRHLYRLHQKNGQKRDSARRHRIFDRRPKKTLSDCPGLRQQEHRSDPGAAGADTVL